MQRFWKDVLGPHIPPTMKMFAWQACSDSLPSKAALAKKVQEVDARCDSCGVLQEPAMHASGRWLLRATTTSLSPDCRKTLAQIR